MRRLLLGLCIWLCVFGLCVPLFPGDAAAIPGGQPSVAQAPRLPLKISPKQRREAKRLFNQAHLAYRRGDYEEAILKWEQSYELSKEPLIFESIANAYERLGDPRRALEHLQKWREKAPRREHKSLDSRIENLQSRITRLEEEERATEQEEEARRQEEADRLAQDHEERRQNEQEDTSAAGGPSTMEILGYSLIGVGGAAVIAGVVMDIVAGTTRPSEDEACTEQGGSLLCRDALRDDIETSNQLAIAGDITWIAGAAMAAGGVIVLFTLVEPGDAGDGTDDDESTDPSELDARLLPFAGPAGGGLVLTGQF
ncbi:MAG: tetratricopeptide repeat protein [Deltaproteobacteria bacterium]|nr:tetratricopeptide repeat protein [Deltaproteobacteria bacterium]